MVSPAQSTDFSNAQALFEPLHALAALGRELRGEIVGTFSRDGSLEEIWRFHFAGPGAGHDPIRLGLFAGVHGDEPAGCTALAQFLIALAAEPQRAAGYELWAYPIVNPTGYRCGTRETSAGKDLNREFWRQSSQPEVRFLESEITLHALNGIITLHADDTSNGLYGFVSGAVLSEHLIEPALLAAEQFLPRNRERVIDGFDAQRGIIADGYRGVLQALPSITSPPFEITFETPQKSPLHLQVEAFNAALQTILVEYRYLLAIAQNI